MSIKQARVANELARVYFKTDLNPGTFQRITDSGILLPIASTWAFVAGLILACPIVAGWDFWFGFYFDLLVTDQGAVILYLYSNTGKYALVLLFSALLGWSKWFSAQPTSHNTHLSSTVLALGILLLVLPTYIETLSYLVSFAGAVFVANIASVLILGRPLRLSLPARRRRSPNLPPADDLM